MSKDVWRMGTYFGIHIWGVSIALNLTPMFIAVWVPGWKDTIRED